MSHPKPLTAEELARGDSTRLAALADALAAFDQEDMFATARAELIVGVWDQTSPINGIDAETVLTSAAPPAGGAVVTIARGDAEHQVVQVLQPFDPEGGPGAAIAPEQAQEIGDRMADAMAADVARQQVLQQIPAELLAFPDPTPQPGDGSGGDGGDGGTPGGDPLAALQAQVSAQQELVTSQASQIAAQQESIDWLAGIVLDLSTGTEADQ